MGYDYALVHAYFTIPPALLLTICAYPVLNRRHVYAISALILIAFTSTVPWDSYPIRRGFWTYPPESILGPRFFDIPLEECFFFVIQTYITSLLYTLANKPLLHPLYLESDSTRPPRTKWIYHMIQAFLVSATITGAALILKGGETTYFGLILAWASPVALLTFSLGGTFILALPWTSTLLPLLLPTLYLWHVDDLALHAGTWAITPGTKTNTMVWGLGSGHLDIEEALFFLTTNTLVVFGLAAFDNALAIIDAFPAIFPDEGTGLPSPATLLRALLVPSSQYDMRRIEGIREAAARLRRKSRSFYLASSAFTGRLRIDLVLLYSFCRMADDLVDEGAPGTRGSEFAQVKTEEWIDRLEQFLNVAFDGSRKQEEVAAFVEKKFPAEARSALLYLPIDGLNGSKKALIRLLEGFRTDLRFPTPSQQAENERKEAEVSRQYPIADEADLVAYGRCVASTVGEMCVKLILYHHGRDAIPKSSSDDVPSDNDRLVKAASNMGVALQLVNIARDIHVDARIGRVYIPTSWLKAEGLSPQAFINGLTDPDPRQTSIDAKDVEAIAKRCRRRLLDWAFAIYDEARPAMRMLPRGSRGAMIVAVESYMEIGRVLKEKEGTGAGLAQSGAGRKATVSKGRRLWVALRALMSD